MQITIISVITINCLKLTSNRQNINSEQVIDLRNLNNQYLNELPPRNSRRTLVEGMSEVLMGRK